LAAWQDPKTGNGIAEQFEQPSVRQSIAVDMEMIRTYDGILSQLEKSIIKLANNHDPVSYALLQSIPGVGRIIALIILYEIENICRFASVQDFASLMSPQIRKGKIVNNRNCPDIGRIYAIQDDTGLMGFDQ
jgi:transposase